MKKIYICHPYFGNEKENILKVKAIAQDIAEEGCLPIAPHLYFPNWIPDKIDRKLETNIYFEFLSLCDEVRVYGGEITELMTIEINFAQQNDIPIIFKNN